MCHLASRGNCLSNARGTLMIEIWSKRRAGKLTAAHLDFARKSPLDVQSDQFVGNGYSVYIVAVTKFVRSPSSDYTE